MHLRVFVKKKEVLRSFAWIYPVILITTTTTLLSCCISKASGRTHPDPSPSSTHSSNADLSDDDSHDKLTIFRSNVYFEKNVTPVTPRCRFHSASKFLLCTNLTSWYELQKMLDHPKYWQEFHHSEFNSSIGAVAAAALDNVMRLQISYCRFGSDFSFKLLSNFVSVKQLVLTHNYFYKGEMAALVYSVESQLELLDLSSNNLVKLPSKAFKEFPNLQTINMSNNNITAFEEDLFVHNTKLKNIYLRGNPLTCNEIQGFLKWIQRSRPNGVVVHESDKVVCDYYVDREIFGTATFQNLIDQCPANCTCLQIRAFVQVDCRNKGYRSFPPLLPNATNTLHMENNRIDSFQSLMNGSNYASVHFLYVDNNLIESINILERTDLFYRLIALHLSGNLLTKLSTYMIERRMMESLDDVQLGNNPWNCECKVVAPFHDLLLKHYKRIRDIDQVLCSSDGPHPNERIHKLSKHDLCASHGTINPLDIVNASLIVIILLIIGKVLYDYRTLKRTGQIPLGPLNCYGYPKHTQ